MGKYKSMMLVVTLAYIVAAAPSVRKATNSVFFPYFDARSHSVNQCQLRITSRGSLGSTDNGDLERPHFYGCAFPANSGIEHLYSSALWIGAVTEDDTLVSVGADPTFGMEFFSLGNPRGISERSSSPSDTLFDPVAIAPQEFVVSFQDTARDPSLVIADPAEERPHIPLSLSVDLISRAWNNSPNDDFVVLSYTIHNIGSQQLRDVYVGLFFDADIMHLDTETGFLDDLAGSLWIPAARGEDSLLVAYVIDNDGDPNELGLWDSQSARSAFGFTFLDLPPGTRPSFNWWFIDLWRAHCDLGPRQVGDNRELNRYGTGTPLGDRNKYWVMSRNSVDPDALFYTSSLRFPDWQPDPPYIVHDLYAPSTDTQILVSFGSFNLAPGDSVIFTAAVIMGALVHVHPENLSRLYDRDDPVPYYESFDFRDLIANTQVADALVHKHLFGRSGDFDRSGEVSLADAVSLLNYVFKNGPAPHFANAMDINGDCQITFADAILLIRYLYQKNAVLQRGCAE